MKPASIVQKVKEKFPEFNMHKFINAWKKLKVRPSKDSDEPENTDTKFCHYDPVDKDYRYEPEFVDLICDHLKRGESFTKR